MLGYGHVLLLLVGGRLLVEHGLRITAIRGITPSTLIGISRNVASETVTAFITDRIRLETQQVRDGGSPNFCSCVWGGVKVKHVNTREAEQDANECR